MVHFQCKNIMFSAFSERLHGFRLKLVFDPELEKRNAYIFVDLSKTPTVDSLTKDIGRRFNLEHDVHITLDECEVLPDEHILVLASTEQVRVHSTSRSQDDTCHDSNIKKKVTHLFKNTNYDDVYSTQTRHVSVDCNVSMDETDDRVPEKAFQFSGKRTKKVDGNRSLAKFLEQLQENNRKYEESVSPPARSLVHDNDIAMGHESKSDLSCSMEKYPREVDSKFEIIENNEGSNETRKSFAGVYEADLDLKKRKRKRKHSKKKREYERIETDEFDAPLKPEFSGVAPSRKHIRFNDVDGEGSQDTSSTSRGIESEMLQFVDRRIPRNQTASSFYSRNSCESDLASSICSENPPPSACYQTKSLERHHLPKTNNSFCAADIMNNSFPVSKPRPDESYIEKELAAMLMLKDLKSTGNYTVQYIEKKINAGSKNQFHGENWRTGPLNITEPIYNHFSQLPKSDSSPRRKTESMESVVDETIEVAHPIHEKLNHTDPNDCEMLMHSKIVDDKIYLRTSSIEWKHVTADTADDFLSPCTMPAEGQSIVFQLLYLQENSSPMSSGLIFGRVLKYEESVGKVVLEIPRVFLNELMRRCKTDESDLPEGIVHVSANVFELDWFAVKNPKLLS